MQDGHARSDVKIIEDRRGDYVISTDPDRLDLAVIYEFLTSCYWAKGIPREVVARSIEHSLCFGVYHGSGAQVGFARVVSDFAIIAYLGDVFILDAHRDHGLDKWLMACIMQHPTLQGLRRWIPLTRDAHGLYSQFGFTSLESPERYMELHQADVYKTPLSSSSEPESEFRKTT